MSRESLLGPGPVGLDTAVFIYFIEDHPEWAPRVAPLFELVATGDIEAVTSAVTLLETLVVPFRAGDFALARRYELLLTRSRHLTMSPLSRQLLRAAAVLRAIHRVRTPDALQLAAAIARGCSTFVTHDKRLPSIPKIRIVQIEELGP